MQTVRRVTPTDDLPANMRKLVDAAFRNAVIEIGEEELFYVGQNFDRKVSAVSASRIPWVRDLAAQMTALRSIYQAHTSGELDLNQEAVEMIGATLFYFVNPYDLVPDHLPGRGYLDDAYVLDRCVHALEKLAPECVD